MKKGPCGSLPKLPKPISMVVPSLATRLDGGFGSFGSYSGGHIFKSKPERGGTAPVCLRPMESPNPPGAVRRLTGSNHPPI
jgi:hypothetical protein